MTYEYVFLPYLSRSFFDRYTYPLCLHTQPDISSHACGCFSFMGIVTTKLRKFDKHKSTHRIASIVLALDDGTSKRVNARLAIVIAC